MFECFEPGFCSESTGYGYVYVDGICIGDYSFNCLDCLLFIYI